eukprot:TRINITY_DN43286_c0_g1_i2.p1 TRINITY_DN43286_c0_g1~~TRINITY_DN43286_c0_g1_i2.p1  ORF type:complete len:165 (-),score=62.12 TRINITY_DN43286_c0_g1_i2:293-787(-)
MLRSLVGSEMCIRDRASAAPPEAEDLAEDEEPSIDDVAVEFMRSAMQAEEMRLQEMGQRVLPLWIKNCSVCTIEGEDCLYNRVEVDTKFDFKKVTQIMVAPPQEIPEKAGYLYCNVVLLIDQSKPPLLMPYLYEQREENLLQHWYFINSSMASALHHVEQFDEV